MKLPGIKRIVPLILTVLLLPALLIVPVGADETDSTLVEILDFSMPNGGDTPWVGVLLSDPLVTFYTPYYSAINYLDVVIQISNNTIPVAVYLKYVGRSGQEEVRLHFTKISDTMYRIYGTGATYTEDVFALRFDFGDSTANAASITFKSVKYSPIPLEIYEMPVVGTLYNYGYSGPIGSDSSSIPFSYKADSVEATVQFTAFSEFDNSFLADMVPYNWQKYDYMDIHCAAWCQSIISVSAFLTDGTVVPLEVSTLVGEQAENTALHIISIRADLTALNRDFDGLLQLTVTGSMYRGETCSFTLYGCRGGLNTESVDPIIHWLMSISRSVSDGFSSIVDAIGGSGDASGVTDDINVAVGELQQAGAALDSVQRPDLGKVDINVVGMVDPAGLSGIASIVSLFTGNSLIYTVMFMFLTLSLISYILFGKR